MKKLFVIGSVLTLMAFASYAGYKYYLHHQFLNKSFDLSFKSPPMLWAHRGYHKDHPENSLEAFRAAKIRGYEGIELDVFYFENEFVISHDDPSSNSDTLLTLDEVFYEFNTGLYYWVDLKNLNAINVESSGNIMLELLSKYQIQDRVFIESKEIEQLDKYTKKGIQTLWWINPGTTYEKMKAGLPYYRKAFATYDFTAISIPHKMITSEFYYNFKHVPKFTFTINDTSRVKELQDIERLVVILTDELHPFPPIYQ